jgi:hypothetical protein
METYSNTYQDQQYEIFNVFNVLNDSDVEFIRSIMDYTKVMGSSLMPGDNDYLTKTNERIYENLIHPKSEQQEVFDDLTDPSAYLDITYDSLDDEDYSHSDDDNTFSDTESEGDGDWVTM